MSGFLENETYHPPECSSPTHLNENIRFAEKLSHEDPQTRGGPHLYASLMVLSQTLTQRKSIPFLSLLEGRSGSIHLRLSSYKPYFHPQLIDRGSPP